MCPDTLSIIKAGKCSGRCSDVLVGVSRQFPAGLWSLTCAVTWYCDNCSAFKESVYLNIYIYILAFYVACTLACYLAYILAYGHTFLHSAFYLVYILVLYLAINLTLYLPWRSIWRKLRHSIVYIFDILSGTYSAHLAVYLVRVI